MKSKKYPYPCPKCGEDIIDPKYEYSEHYCKNRNKNDIHLSDGTIFVDWNKFTMDELAAYLERKWMFQSSGEALAINKMVEFYKSNKDKV